MASNTTVLDIRQIMDLIPHRYPFLLVDRVVEFEAGSHIVAYKNVTFNEPFFQGHFPGLPVMPGVLMIEALAQTGGLYVMQDPSIDIVGKVFMFTGINKVKFRRPVMPGDRLTLRMSDFVRKMSLWKMQGVAEVDGELACVAELSAALVDKENL
jgi:3-hydroxyacyl-[acyl-carrier-protein] dehydratase